MVPVGHCLGRGKSSLFLQDGRLHLRTTPGQQQSRPYIWDTPNPPPLSLCNIMPLGNSSSRRLHVVDTQNIQGITFFFYKSQILNIHIHSPDKPCANYAYESLDPMTPSQVTAIYLPLPPTDKMLVLGIRQSSSMVGWMDNILVRMEKAGDIVIGETGFPPYRSNAEGMSLGFTDECLAANGPVTLLYGESEGRNTISAFGAYCKPGNSVDLPKPFVRETPSHTVLGLGNFYSRAPLSGIAMSTVFKDAESGDCQGILLQYENGGCRALGQCLMDVYPCERTAQPTSIHIRREIDPYLASAIAKARFVCDGQGNELEEGWICYPLQGFIEFYLGYKERDIEIESGFSRDIASEWYRQEGPPPRKFTERALRKSMQSHVHTFSPECRHVNQWL